MSGVFLYQINVTRGCNLRCAHCYISSDVKDRSGSMGKDQVIALGREIRRHMERNGKQRAEIHFIGGEPTLLGIDWFEEVLPAFKESLGSSFDIDLSLVTNLLTADAVRIANLFDRINTSWEPDTRFISWAGKRKSGMEKIWERNVQLLLEAGKSVGVTTAITKGIVEIGAAAALDRLHGIGVRKIHLGFFIPEGDGLANIDSIMPRFSETSQVLMDAADWYLERRDNDDALWVNPVESMLMSIHRDAPMDDIVCPIVTGSLDIHWDGSARACLEAGGGANPQWDGNVFLDGIEAITSGSQYQAEVRNALRGHKTCLSCEDRPVCMSGCGVLSRYYRDDSGDCHGFRRFIRYMRHLYEQGVRPRCA